ncbi:unnamed protein product [Cochlearia groenlandica]
MTKKTNDATNKTTAIETPEELAANYGEISERLDSTQLDVGNLTDVCNNMQREMRELSTVLLQIQHQLTTMNHSSRRDDSQERRREADLGDIRGNQRQKHVSNSNSEPGRSINALGSKDRLMKKVEMSIF